MFDIRKIIIILVIGVLFSILVFATIEAVYPRPEYNDFCKRDYDAKPMTRQDDCEALDVPDNERQSCVEEGGYIKFTYDSTGCADGYYCEMCQKQYDDAREQYNRVVFYVSAALSLIAIFIGIFLPAKTNTLNEWVGTGFMLGGAFALFFGTAQSFSSLDRIVRPIVIFLELALVIFISYRKIGNFKK